MLRFASASAGSVAGRGCAQLTAALPGCRKRCAAYRRYGGFLPV